MEQTGHLFGGQIGGNCGESYNICIKFVLLADLQLQKNP